MWKMLALVACCGAVIAVPVALASEGDSTPQPEALPPSPTNSLPEPPCSNRSELKRIYALRKWDQTARPMAGKDPACRGLDRFQEKLKLGFQRWRTYRLAVSVGPAPAGGFDGCSGGGRWLRYTSIPGEVVFRESGCSWTAYNPSGACGPYQLLGWTSCATGTFEDKMRHHREAGHILETSGPDAWTAW